MNHTQKEIYSFLNQNPLGVISTLATGSSQPESALVAFAETKQLELIFQTFVDSRKYANLKSNPKVSFVTGWSLESYVTLQYEGVAEEISAENLEEFKTIFKAKDTPCTDEFLNNPKCRFFLVKPTWIGYSDYTQAKPGVVELHF